LTGEEVLDHWLDDAQLLTVNTRFAVATFWSGHDLRALKVCDCFKAPEEERQEMRNEIDVLRYLNENNGKFFISFEYSDLF
jgi:hypothetical protein